MSPADRANLEMVDRLIAQEALWSRPLIAAFRHTPRHAFLHRIYQAERDATWTDVPLRPLGADEVEITYSDRALTTRIAQPPTGGPPVAVSSSSQPSLMAQMLEDLRPASGQRVLEIGAGTGYNAALLAHVVGPGRVLSVDVDRAVLAEADEHLRDFADRRVRLLHADGRQPIPGEAPFDRVMVTASTPDLEPAWLKQLVPGGVVLAPLALAPGLAFVLRGTVERGVFRGQLTRPAFFMPLRAEEETGTGGTSGLSPPETLDSVPAPWADWLSQRRGRLGVRGLLQSLAFLAWLRGLTVGYTSYGDAPMFGLGDLVRGCVCWVGSSRWHVSGAEGQVLGEELWRNFLEAGAPCPTEWDLTAAPELKAPKPAADTFVRAGPRCRQTWRLREVRDRLAAF